jgi:hypothetical protein
MKRMYKKVAIALAAASAAVALVVATTRYETRYVDLGSGEIVVERTLCGVVTSSETVDSVLPTTLRAASMSPSNERVLVRSAPVGERSCQSTYGMYFVTECKHWVMELEIDQYSGKSIDVAAELARWERIKEMARRRESIVPVMPQR